MYYCKRCKKEVSGFHRCFTGLRGLKASKNPSNAKKNISFHLLERIKNYTELPKVNEDAYVKRLRPGTNDRSHGAWLWNIENNGIYQIGSPHTMTDCLFAIKWEIYNSYDWFEIIIDS